MSAHTLLSPAVIEQIDAWLAKFPEDQRQSAVLPALRVTQEANNGSLTEGLMDAVAEYLGIPKIAVYECATFYSMYELEPVGRYVIDFCSNISCMLCGSEETIAHTEKRLGVKVGQTTPDGRFTLRSVECLGACAGAPAIQVNDRKYHEYMAVDKMNELIDQLEQEDRANGNK